MSLIKQGTVVTRENVMAEAHKLARQLKVCMRYKHALQFALKELYRYMFECEKQVVIHWSENSQLKKIVGVNPDRKTGASVNKMIPFARYISIMQKLAHEYIDIGYDKIKISLVSNGYIKDHGTDYLNRNWKKFSF